MSDAVDVLIMGAGPAGLQAAVHAVRKKASVVVVGRPERSAIYRAHVENYLCVDGITDGHEMIEVAIAQATRFGAQLIEEDVLHVEAEEEGGFLVRTEGKRFHALSIIIAIGTSKKKLRVPGENELAGKGVSYCVDCDCNFYRKAKVVVVGNESAAVDGAITLTKYASEVTLICKDLVVSDAMHQRLAESSVVVKQDAWVKEIVGDTAVTSVVLDDDSILEVDGVFIELGSKGPMELATAIGVELDMETFSYINTNKKMETNISGVYAAGDIAGQPFQMAKAVGEGCVAGWEAANYVKKLKRERGE
ncbi:MAG: NAD(P)/FAD-dependent oxidoreductase [Proteobacteria bacterium]|nr:NAD(P)/FAD-dependent oxidoreductase [Pseudomonadota bacterium]MBU1640989.1 NAD(P)/FAD-dependent oxidoreductase [Pseudomonadota bacterium]